MNCAEFLDLLNPYLDDKLAQQLQAEVQAHLADCPDCSHEATNWQTCLGWLRKTFPDQAPSAELREKIQTAVER